MVTVPGPAEAILTARLQLDAGVAEVADALTHDDAASVVLTAAEDRTFRGASDFISEAPLSSSMLPGGMLGGGSSPGCSFFPVAALAWILTGRRMYPSPREL